MAKLALLGMVFGLASPLVGQSARDSAHKTFFVKRDLVTAGAIVGVSALTSVFDQRISYWWQSPRVQGDSSRSDLVEALTFVNEKPLTAAAVAAYGIGRLAHNETLADIGLHTAEALVLSVGMSEVIRTTLGRYRPRESPDDPFHFKFGAGFTQFGARSYPSVHADAAFAVASVLAGELRMRAPHNARYTTPLLYTAAMVPGITRMYLNQHWASDIVAGSLVGWCSARASSTTRTAIAATSWIGPCSASPPFPMVMAGCCSRYRSTRRSGSDRNGGTGSSWLERRKEPSRSKCRRTSL